MINSETISFKIKTYGEFRMDGSGLTYPSKQSAELDRDGAKALIKTFNQLYADAVHLTPVEAVDKIPEHFTVFRSWITHVKESNKVPIELAPDGALF